MASNVHAIIVADGDVDAARLAALVTEVQGAEGRRVIAADGGAAKSLAAGVRPDLVVGDFDSLAPGDHDRLDEMGIVLQVASPDKDESDMELCLLAALDTGASRISIVGALGGSRPEHSIANLLLLADARLDGIDAAIMTTASIIRRMGTAAGPGECPLEGLPGDFVSLFPVAGDVEGVTTQGLRFPLHDEALPVGPARGLSNELIDTRASVRSRRGRLLVVHTRHT